MRGGTSLAVDERDLSYVAELVLGEQLVERGTRRLPVPHQRETGRSVALLGERLRRYGTGAGERHAHAAPVLNARDWTATPSSRPSGSQATIEYVTSTTLPRVDDPPRPRDPGRSERHDERLRALHESSADRVLVVTTPIAEACVRASTTGPLPVIDSLLAATALVHGLVVVTRDTRPSERLGVPSLDPWAG